MEEHHENETLRAGQAERLRTTRSTVLPVAAVLVILARAPRVLLAVSLALLPLILASAAQAQFADVYEFLGGPGAETPIGPLIADADGNLYGTTLGGGVYGYGTVYELPATGGENVLYSFTGGADGAFPVGGVLRDGKGNLYGTAQYGGNLSSTCPLAEGCGVVFVVNPNGKERVLHTFTGGGDGSAPAAGLTRGAGGNFYGTTYYGGSYAEGSCVDAGCGVVFRLDLEGNETVLYQFLGQPDGELPLAPVVPDSAGNLYGTTLAGGISGGTCTEYGCGVVFKLDSSGNETLLYTFTGGADGGSPGSGALSLDPGGNLYGTTGYGGDVCGAPGGCGVVFEVSPTGVENVLYGFADGTDGGYPSGGVVRDGRGNLYGTTAWGGSDNAGVVFSLSPAGQETVLHSFDVSDGFQPSGTLMFYKGNLYGPTGYGGRQGDGVVFRQGQ
jgi:uncharacterized repeat protein (TIGR03803 family)